METAETIEKNRRIVKGELVEQMNIGLKHIEKLIGRMYGGVLTGLILNPIAKLIYRIMLSDDIKKKTKKQIDIILECANLFNSRIKEIENNGKNKNFKAEKERILNEIIDRYFEDYRQNDQSFHHCKKEHKIYPQIEHIMKEVFRARIEPAKQLLTSYGNNYDELARNAFTKEEALANVNREFKATAELLELIKNNMDIIDVPSIIRSKIVDIMLKAFEMTKKQLYGRIDEIYNGYK